MRQHDPRRAPLRPLQQPLRRPCGGVCQLSACADAGETNCGGACFDLRTNSLHCGNCATACTAGLPCRLGVCLPAPDAGTPDVTTFDVGTPDSAFVDTFTFDAGTPDTLIFDAGAPEASVIDASVLDRSPPVVGADGGLE
ncbi:MAG: hypothetical protein IPN17_13580 [Deltaproteobacteria bacterium]|nr:hypothetical protein [Deltaproteobacteria bacterium]